MKSGGYQNDEHQKRLVCKMPTNQNNKSKTSYLYIQDME